MTKRPEPRQVEVRAAYDSECQSILLFGQNADFEIGAGIVDDVAIIFLVVSGELGRSRAAVRIAVEDAVGFGVYVSVEILNEQKFR